jgi:hypothetical protein
MANFRFFSGSGGGDNTKIVINTSINESVNDGDILRSKVAGSHGLLEKANDTGLNAVGVAMASGSVGGTIDVMYFGTYQVNFADSLTSSDIGKRVFVSSTSGQATITPPTASGKTLIELGYLRDTNGTCFINPQTLMIL